jgi:hypothetical protein
MPIKYKFMGIIFLSAMQLCDCNIDIYGYAV